MRTTQCTLMTTDRSPSPITSPSPAPAPSPYHTTHSTSLSFGCARACRGESNDQTGCSAGICGSWNVSLFHYRNHGADVGRVLVGIQVPDSELAQLDEFLRCLGWACSQQSCPHRTDSSHPRRLSYVRACVLGCFQIRVPRRERQRYIWAVLAVAEMRRN